MTRESWASHRDCVRACIGGDACLDFCSSIWASRMPLSRCRQAARDSITSPIGGGGLMIQMNNRLQAIAGDRGHPYLQRRPRRSRSQSRHRSHRPVAWNLDRLLRTWCVAFYAEAGLKPCATSHCATSRRATGRTVLCAVVRARPGSSASHPSAASRARDRRASGLRSGTPGNS